MENCQGCRAGKTGFESNSGEKRTEARNAEGGGARKCTNAEGGRARKCTNPFFLQLLNQRLIPGDHLVCSFTMARKSRVSQMSKSETTENRPCSQAIVIGHTSENMSHRQTFG